MTESPQDGVRAAQVQDALEQMQIIEEQWHEEDEEECSVGHQECVGD